MPASTYIVLRELVCLFLKLLYVFLLVFASREALTSECLVEVLNMALFVLLVGTAVAMFSDSLYGFTEGRLGAQFTHRPIGSDKNHGGLCGDAYSYNLRKPNRTSLRQK